MGSDVRVVVTVPAFGWLWSDHDVFLGHQRRYTLGQLERVLRTAGLRVEFGCYYFGLVLPAVAAVRLGQRLARGRRAAPKSDMRGFGSVSNTLLWAACRAELLVWRNNRLGGLSVFMRAVK
jgi:hypothetical protein